MPATPRSESASQQSAVCHPVRVTTETAPEWIRSKSCSGGQCVEVARVGDRYLIRDSKHPEVQPLAFDGDEWAAFVAGVQAGEFRL